jgi:hypothetical protein
MPGLRAVAWTIPATFLLEPLKEHANKAEKELWVSPALLLTKACWGSFEEPYHGCTPPQSTAQEGLKRKCWKLLCSAVPVSTPEKFYLPVPQTTPTPNERNWDQGGVGNTPALRAHSLKIWRETLPSISHIPLTLCLASTSAERHFVGFSCDPLLLDPTWALQLEDWGQSNPQLLPCSLVYTAREGLRSCIWESMHTVAAEKNNKTFSASTHMWVPCINHPCTLRGHILLTRLLWVLQRRCCDYCPCLSPLPDHTLHDVDTKASR